MAKKLCKCSVCGLQFDRNSVQAVKSGARRYAHYDCMPEGELVPMEDAAAADPDLAALKEYITKLFGESANWRLINKQIKDYTTNEGYTITGILKSLIFFFEIKHNDISKANNAIGIVPFVYKQSRDYYYAIWLAQQSNIEKNISIETKEIIIKTPSNVNIKKRILNWEIDEDE